MSKHTQGPWYAVGMWVEIEDDDKPDICTCNPSAIEQGHLYRSAEEIYANARLIAAAPDLLASLEEVLAYCREHGHDWACMTEAQAAINKATGEQA